ncbi:hypothetical protein D3C81_1089520 [compost metagenome]
MLLAHRQMGVLAAGEATQRFPGLHRHVAIGFRGQVQDHFGRIDRGRDGRPALADALLVHGVVQLAEELHLVLGVPVHALAAIAVLVQQRPQRGELAIQVRVIALHHRHRRHGLAGDGLALALLPVGHAERHAQLVGGVVQGRHQHQVLLHPQHAGRHLAHGARNLLEDVPVTARFPRRVHRLRQRMDERMHVRGVEIVLLVPGGRRQHDVRIQRGGAHAEVQRHQQIELAFRRLVAPLHFLRFYRAHLAQVLALQAVAGTQQVPQHVLVALARRTQQVRAPDEHHPRVVLLRVRIGEGEVQRTVLELAQCVIGRGHAGRFGLAHQLQRIAIQLRRAWQPAHAHGAQVQVGQAAAVLAGVGQR